VHYLEPLKQKSKLISPRSRSDVNNRPKYNFWVLNIEFQAKLAQGKKRNSLRTRQISSFSGLKFSNYRLFPYFDYVGVFTGKLYFILFVPMVEYLEHF